MSAEQPNDFVVRLVTVDGVLDIELAERDDRYLARDHFQAVSTYLANGSDKSIEQLARFRDAQIAGHQLEIDPDVIDALDDSGELDLAELYPSRRADRG
jgi:hypothetical protein